MSLLDTNRFAVDGVGVLIKPLIKKVQRGLSIIDGGVASISVTIDAVDLNTTITNAYFFYGGATAGINRILVRSSLTNSTTLDLRRAVSGTGDLTIRWEVIEFEDMANVQSGTTNGLGFPVTINSVDMNKSFIMFSNTSTSTSDGAIFFTEPPLYLSNSTTLSAIANDSQSTYTWYVVETP